MKSFIRILNPLPTPAALAPCPSFPQGHSSRASPSLFFLESATPHHSLSLSHSLSLLLRPSACQSRGVQKLMSPEPRGVRALLLAACRSHNVCWRTRQSLGLEPRSRRWIQEISEWIHPIRGAAVLPTPSEQAGNAPPSPSSVAPFLCLARRLGRYPEGG